MASSNALVLSTNTREVVFRDTIRRMRDEILLKFAAREHRNIANLLLELFEKLTYHEAIEPNLHQPQFLPPVSRNRIAFMWDYIERTFVGIQSTLPESSLIHLDNIGIAH